MTEKSQLTCHKARTTTALQGLVVSMSKYVNAKPGDRQTLVTVPLPSVLQSGMHDQRHFQPDEIPGN